MARTVSHSERVLILLEDLEGYCDAVEVPFLLCQEGMAERLGLHIQNMSRTLAKMQEEGLISERLAHVSGVGRRRKVYHLTETGRGAASKVVEDITSSQVSVKEDKTTRAMSANELRSLLKDRGKVVPLLDLVDILSKGSVAIEDLPSGRSRQDVPPPFLAIGKPDPVEMIGRKEELAGVDSLISDPKVKCMLIWGLPGMGKTTLGMAIFDRLKGRRPLFWYTVREFDSENDVLGPLANMMRESGHRQTSNALATADLAQMYGPLSSDLSKWKGMIFIDDAHKSGEGMNAALNLLIEACKAQSGSKIVLMSRMMNKAFSHNREDLADIELQGLKPSDAEEVVRRAGHETDGLSLEGTEGNPLLIQMAVRNRGGEVPRSPSDYVDNLWSHLSEKEREGLKALAVFREFVPPAALQMDTEIIFDLRAKGIVQKRESWIMLHDLIGSRVRQLTTEKESVRLHRAAWEHYSRSPDRDHLLEGMYHLAEAGDGASFVDVLGRNGETLLDRPEELIALVDRMRPKIEDRRSDLALLFWRARASLSLERYDDAERALETILTAEGTDPEMKGMALESMADLHHMVEEWDEALAGYKKALAHYEASRDPGPQAREWLNIGRTLRIRGDRTASLEAYSKAASLMPKDKKLNALIFNNRGMVEWSAGRLEEAEKEFRESIRRSRENKDPLSEGMALQNLVDMYQESLRYDEMMLAARDASDAFIRADDVDSYANMQMRMASHLDRSGKLQQALEVLQQALSRVRGNILAPSHASTRARISTSEMAILRRMGRPRESIETGKGFERPRTVPADVAARLYLEMALAEADLGELEKALSHLDMAASLLTEALDQVGLTLVLIEKGEIEERRGNAEEAAKLYREAAWRADGTGDKMGLATALEYLFYIIGNDEEEGRMAKERAIRTYDELALPERAARIEANLGDGALVRGP